jgi:hypothetical protein
VSATPYTGLIQTARFHIRAARGNPNDSTYKPDSYWSDDELFNIAKRGTTDLWGAIIDLHEEHYLTVNTTSVTLGAGTEALQGVPADCFRVYMIEPLDPTTTQCAFVPRPYNHIEFVNARNSTAGSGQSFSPTSGLNIFYDVTGVGTPLGAPTILTAPLVNAAIPLRFSYISNLGVQQYQLSTATNPISGESDNALIAWIVAYALGKERPDRVPDASWLAIYSTEKQSLLTRMRPRQEQEPLYADGAFDSYWR